MAKLFRFKSAVDSLVFRLLNTVTQSPLNLADLNQNSILGLKYFVPLANSVAFDPEI